MQGSILTDEAVVADAFAVFERIDGEPLVDRLVAAMEVGTMAGGGSRCGEQAARSVFVTIFKRDNKPHRPYFQVLVYGCETDRQPAVVRLVEEFKRWKDYGTEDASTSLYVML
ncbi:hypothetical protein MNBD_PLANCTO03-1944 [hydrothermal vent metagenome]|uniref:Uncharacterized protein n=1 Tax=hydrothermal vent metagenome TaxID=652676 RepID=A0A3B1D686_9ZZZZ